MRQQFPIVGDLDLRIVERQIAFPTHPFDPPSSPPPTSPLPPLPEIRLSSHCSSVSTISPVSPSSRVDPPIRPPCPQTALPNLKPRIITSPEVSNRPSHAAVRVRTRASPTRPSRREKPLRVRDQCPEVDEQSRAAHLPKPTSGSALRFSDDVLGALPKLFNRFSSLQSVHGEPAGYAERLGSGRTDAGRKTTKKPLARSALFIPRTPPKEAPAVFLSDEMKDEGTLWDEKLWLDDQSASKIFEEQMPTRRVESLAPQYRHPIRVSHKRSHAATSFAFDFHDTSTSASSCSSDENLTSLPRIPSDPILFVTSGRGSKSTSQKPIPKISEIREDSEEAITFAVLPYAHTLHSAGPRPKTEKDNKVRFDIECDVEEGEDDVRHLTEEELRAENRKRILWAIATVTLVIVATAGILMGIIWKLRSIT